MYQQPCLISAAPLGSHRAMVDRLVLIFRALSDDNLCKPEICSLWGWQNKNQLDQYPPGERRLIADLWAPSDPVTMVEAKARETSDFGYAVMLPARNAEFRVRNEWYRLLGVNFAVVARPLLPSPALIDGGLSADQLISSIVFFDVCHLEGSRSREEPFRHTLAAFSKKTVEDMIWT